MLNSRQEILPIQPVEQPIICKPYDEPDQYWLYNPDTGEADKTPGRRPAGYYYKLSRNTVQGTLFAENSREDLPLINKLRADVKRWRDSGYESATHITKDLLRYWKREDRLRRFFFCQLEAVETVIYLTEIRGINQDGTRRKPRFVPQFTDEDFYALRDLPNEPDALPLTRFGCKMATGTGKTVVMAMLITWAFCNRGQVSSDERFPRAVLVCCPNLTVKERLQVLRPDNSTGNYYDQFDIVPSSLRPLLNTGKVLVTNWHAFAPESEHAEGGKTYAVVNKGEESPKAFARRVLSDLYDSAPLMVLNDEAHHAYRPAPVLEGISADEKAEREEATIWIAGIDRFNKACGVRVCVDLSATPFYLHGSGHEEGRPFPWLVSDFGLVDAIESGLVKIPRLPVSDTTGRPEPKYFRLWENIRESLPPADFLGGGANRRPKPEAIWNKAEGALKTLASQWKERFEYSQAANAEQERVPPVLILVCDNTDIAQLFFERISGETQEPIGDDTETDETDSEESEEDATPKVRTKKPKTRVAYSDGLIFPELLSNREGFRPTIRIDAKMLAQAESEDPNASRQDAAQQLRRLIATVGKIGEPGEHVRCVVSVAMLTEGWDANNVTHIFGLRAFGSPLLSEQVIGRGLRRMDYAVNKDGYLEPEYVDVYGIPFSIIPYKGRATDKPAPEDKPKNHVKALPERAKFEMRFPNVEGYTFALSKNNIKANIIGMAGLSIEPNREPTAVFVRPSVGYAEGFTSVQGPGEPSLQTRDGFYQSTHIQTIKFEIARQVIIELVGTGTENDTLRKPKLRYQARHQLFPQVLRFVHQYVETKVNFRGQNPCELGLQEYVRQVVERLVAEIEPDEDAGETPLLPILNRYKPFGSTADVDFKTTRRCAPTLFSHINQVVLDTETWESSAAFYLEAAVMKGIVLFYARNDQMGLHIPYEFQGVSHIYQPDYLVRLKNGMTLILEIKGFSDNQTQAKHQAAQRWVSAINNCDKLGKWAFHECHDPALVLTLLRSLITS